jgi:hypothetical protein
MEKFTRFIHYLWYYCEPNSKALRKEAFEAAKEHFSRIPIRTILRPYPTPRDYEYRRLQFQSFQRGYINAYRSSYAKSKLESTE